MVILDQLTILHLMEVQQLAEEVSGMYPYDQWAQTRKSLPSLPTILISIIMCSSLCVGDVQNGKLIHTKFVLIFGVHSTDHGSWW